MSLADRFTNYRSRYGYPLRWALAAEIAWRVEHMPGGSWAYRWRKAAEHHGSELVIPSIFPRLSLLSWRKRK